MLVLVVDTATPAVTAGLVAVEPAAGGPAVELLASRVTIDGKAHGELLSPSIAACLAEARVTPRDLRAVVAGVGPGPFTGLRVGLATATAMGHALGTPTYGVMTLDALAWGTRGRLLVATDARRKELYFGIYEDGRRVSGPSVGKPADIEGVFTAAVGAGAHLYADALTAPVLDTPRFPDVQALATLAAERLLAGATGEKLTPLYLRRPDAVPPGERKHVAPRPR